MMIWNIFSLSVSLLILLNTIFSVQKGIQSYTCYFSRPGSQVYYLTSGNILVSEFLFGLKNIYSGHDMNGGCSITEFQIGQSYNESLFKGNLALYGEVYSKKIKIEEYFFEVSCRNDGYINSSSGPLFSVMGNDYPYVYSGEKPKEKCEMTCTYQKWAENCEIPNKYNSSGVIVIFSLSVFSFFFMLLFCLKNAFLLRIKSKFLFLQNYYDFKGYFDFCNEATKKPVFFDFDDEYISTDYSKPCNFSLRGEIHLNFSDKSYSLDRNGLRVYSTVEKKQLYFDYSGIEDERFYHLMWYLESIYKNYKLSYVRNNDGFYHFVDTLEVCRMIVEDNVSFCIKNSETQFYSYSPDFIDYKNDFHFLTKSIKNVSRSQLFVFFYHNFHFFSEKIKMNALHNCINGNLFFKKRPKDIGNSQWKYYVSDFIKLCSALGILDRKEIDKRACSSAFNKAIKLSKNEIEDYLEKMDEVRKISENKMMSEVVNKSLLSLKNRINEDSTSGLNEKTLTKIKNKIKSLESISEGKKKKLDILEKENSGFLEIMNESDSLLNGLNSLKMKYSEALNENSLPDKSQFLSEKYKMQNSFKFKLYKKNKLKKEEDLEIESILERANKKISEIEEMERDNKKKLESLKDEVAKKRRKIKEKLDCSSKFLIMEDEIIKIKNYYSCLSDLDKVESVKNEYLELLGDKNFEQDLSEFVKTKADSDSKAIYNLENILDKKESIINFNLINESVTMRRSKNNGSSDSQIILKNERRSKNKRENIFRRNFGKKNQAIKSKKINNINSISKCLIKVVVQKESRMYIRTDEDENACKFLSRNLHKNINICKMERPKMLLSYLEEKFYSKNKLESKNNSNNKGKNKVTDDDIRSSNKEKNIKLMENLNPASFREKKTARIFRSEKLSPSEMTGVPSIINFFKLVKKCGFETTNEIFEIIGVNPMTI